MSKSLYHNANVTSKYQSFFFFERKVLRIHVDDGERNVFQYFGGEDSTLLVLNLRVQLDFRQIEITDKVVRIFLC